MQRETAEQADLMEASVTHAVANVMVKDYARKRAAQKRRSNRTPTSGEVIESEWRRLAETMPGAQVGGPRLVN